jgi:signal peptidase I
MSRDSRGEFIDDLGLAGKTMARTTRREAEKEKEGSWKDLARDGLVAVIIVAVVLGGTYAYTGNWPPLVVVESSSMQHGSQASNFGVIDTGDMVFQQVAPTRESVITYLEGRTSGYMTYGDYGDVIIFSTGGDTPIIHRAIMYVTLHDTGPSVDDGSANITLDVPLPDQDWVATNAAGPTRNWIGLKTLTIFYMGYGRNVNLTFDFSMYSSSRDRSGYITKGDNNAGYDKTYVDDGLIPRVQDVIGRARGEIPWIGLIKLTLQPTVAQIVGAFIVAVIALALLRTDRTELLVLVAIIAWILGFAVMKALFPSPPSGAACCDAWGDTTAPRNSWDALLLTLIGIVALPFVYEYAGRGWTKYVSPRLPDIRWPWSRRKPPKPPASDPTRLYGDPSTWDEPLDGADEPPREGSSGP